MALKIKVTRMYPYEGENTQAFFDVKVAIASYEFFFNDLTLVKKKDGDGLFVGFPSRPGKKEGDYFHFCNANKKAKEEIEKAAVMEFKKKSKAKEIAQAGE
jgi:DNA-binding cell septation regulator SpoVG